MTDRIDHAAEARELIEVGLDVDTLPSDIPHILSAAQVHATLALVEQQRIANLIALSEVGDSTGLYDGPFDDGPIFRLKPDIARALGLEVSDD